MHTLRISFLLSLLLLGCSPSAPDSSTSAPAPALERLSSLILTSGSGNFGIVTASSSLVFKVQNPGPDFSEVANLSLVGPQANDFSITYQSGCTRALSNPQEACAFRIFFNGAAKAAGNYTASVVIGALSVPLSAIVLPKPSNSLSLFDGNLLIEDPILGLGMLTRTQSISKVLTLKNNLNLVSAPISVALNNPAFVLSNNNCQNKTLPPNGSCSFKISFSASNKIAASYEGILSFSDREVNVAAVVENPLSGVAGGIVIQSLVNNLIVDGDLELGVYPSNEGSVQLITFKNIGTNTSQPMSVSLSGTNALDFSLVSNTCIDRVLAPGASCSFRLVFSAVGKAPGNYTASLNFSDKVFGIGSSILSGSQCLTNTHKEGNVCVSNIRACAVPHGQGSQVWNGSAYGSCIPHLCESGYDLANQSCLLACAAVEHRDPISFTCAANVLDCTADINLAADATRTWDSGSQAYLACELNSCVAAYHIESNACVSDTRACVIANGQGIETWNGSAYGLCLVSACNLNYHTEANACVDDVQSCPIDHGVGTKLWLGSQYSTCTAQSCESSYHLFDNACDSDVIDCTSQIAHADAATRTWDAPNQVYGTCDLITCASTYHEESNACVDDIQNCAADISNSASATKQWQGSAYSACTAHSCLAGFELLNNTCLTNCAANAHRNYTTAACDLNVIDCTFGNDVVVNGQFSTGSSGWSGSLGQWHSSGYVLLSNSPDGNGANYFGQTISTIVGKQYRVKYDVPVLTGNSGVGNYAYALNFGQNRRDGTKLSGDSLTNSPITNKTYEFTAQAAQTDIVWATEAQLGTTSVDNVSVLPYSIINTIFATQTWNGSAYGSCQAITCRSGYLLSDNSCTTLVDSNFDANTGSGANDTVASIAVQANRKILLAGYFTTFNSAARQGLIRLNTDGTADTAFNANLGSGSAGTGYHSVYNVEVQPSDQKILISNGFVYWNGAFRQGLVRLNTDGTEDLAFRNNILQVTDYRGQLTYPDGGYIMMGPTKVQTDGKILVGGNFFFYGGQARSQLIRLNADGTEDTAFYANYNGYYGSGITISSFQLTPDNKILFAANFQPLRRLNMDGSPDLSFPVHTLGNGPVGSGAIQDFKIQPDGKILVVGSFGSVDGVPARGVFRMNADGSLDMPFINNVAQGFGGSVAYPGLYMSTVEIDDAGNIFVGGNFTAFNNVSPRNYLVRLNSDGTEYVPFYTSLGSAFNNVIYKVVLDGFQHLLVGGGFSSVNGNSNYSGFIRLNYEN